LLVLTCGLHGNVLRLLPPLTLVDDELTEGLDILEEAVSVACAR
jgi:4-aminobutyrate aminotransferase-like enzyme